MTTDKIAKEIAKIRAASDKMRYLSDDDITFRALAAMAAVMEAAHERKTKPTAIFFEDPRLTPRSIP